MDCASFVSLVLDIAGIREGTKGIPKNKPKGLNRTNTYGRGVPNIIHTDIFDDVQGGQVRVGDIAYTGTEGHVLIVSKVENGKAVKFIHSSSWDYNYGERLSKKTGVKVRRAKRTGIGVHESSFWHDSGVKYKRVR